MSLHPTLKGSKELSSKKTVLKRGERIKWLMDKKQWKENNSVLGLPKIKIVKLKIAKKDKKEEKKEEEGQQPAQEAKK